MTPETCQGQKREKRKSRKTKTKPYFSRITVKCWRIGRDREPAENCKNHAPIFRVREYPVPRSVANKDTIDY